MLSYILVLEYRKGVEYDIDLGLKDSDALQMLHNTRNPISGRAPSSGLNV